MKSEKSIAVHWADITAEKIIREKGDKGTYVCASGITPSGTVHIGNFREIISVELIVRALRERGKNVRFIYSWDDYDVFRKVPANMPEPELLGEYLRKPITLVPDTRGSWANYAEANEKDLEELLPVVGIRPEYLYQAERYGASKYAAGIRTALEKRKIIRGILNEHRSSPLPAEWWPVSVFSSFTDKDTTTVLGWDGEWGVTYRCEETKKEETVDIRNTSVVKLQWRVDWPMRWKEEGVDFEPAGKDHHTEGGSFDTAKRIVSEVYGGEPPVTFQYDFISIKGRGGKISSSSGDVVDLREVLEVFQPEIVRYLFAGTRPNTEFAISFDLDVLKIYEDYDKCERVYYGLQDMGAKKRDKELRIFELSQVDGVPMKCSYQVPLRHLCNLLQIHAGDIDQVISLFDQIDSEQTGRLGVRCRCAWNWITRFSPEDFRFSLRNPDEPVEGLSETEKKAIALLSAEVDRLEHHDEKSLAEAIYGIAEKEGMDPKDFFVTVYRTLIRQERGPRLAAFIITAGKEKIGPLLRI